MGDGSRTRELRRPDQGRAHTGVLVAAGKGPGVEAAAGVSDGAVIVALLGNGEEVTVERLYREGELLRLVPENGGYEELVVSAGEATVQGRVIYVAHPSRRRSPAR